MDRDTNLVNLRVLKQHDPSIDEILYRAKHVTIYELDESAEWKRKDVEGTLFIVRRTQAPRNQFIVLNRLSTELFIEDLNENEDFQFEHNDNIVIYQNSRGEDRGVWFYSETERNDFLFMLAQLLGTAPHQSPRTSNDAVGFPSPMPPRQSQPQPQQHGLDQIRDSIFNALTSSSSSLPAPATAAAPSTVQLRNSNGQGIPMPGAIAAVPLPTQDGGMMSPNVMALFQAAAQGQQLNGNHNNTDGLPPHQSHAATLARVPGMVGSPAPVASPASAPGSSFVAPFAPQPSHHTQPAAGFVTKQEDTDRNNATVSDAVRDGLPQLREMVANGGASAAPPSPTTKNSGPGNAPKQKQLKQQLLSPDDILRFATRSDDTTATSSTSRAAPAPTTATTTQPPTTTASTKRERKQQQAQTQTQAQSQPQPQGVTSTKPPLSREEFKQMLLKLVSSDPFLDKVYAEYTSRSGSNTAGPSQAQPPNK